ncbi:MAG: DUF5906 domain-containing protein [Planctomycetota bacterium]
MDRIDWQRVRPNKPCPVCGKKKLCRYEPPYGLARVQCGTTDAATVAAAQAAGWVPGAVTPAAGQIPQCQIYTPGGFEPPQMIQRRTRPRDKTSAERRSRRARELYQAAAGGQAHPIVREYLEGRGIDIAGLPGGRLPPTLRYTPACFEFVTGDDSEDLGKARDILAQSLAPAEAIENVPEETLTPMGVVRVRRRTKDGKRIAWVTRECPAIVGAVRPSVVQAGAPRVQAVHRIFLDPGGKVMKRGHGELDAAKKALGPIGAGYAIWLSDAIEQGGTIIVAEGIETALACSCATGLPAVSTISAHGMQGFELPPELVDVISTVIVAGDLDRVIDGNREGSCTGQRAARACVDALSSRHSALRVVARLPSVVLPDERLTVFDGLPAPLGGSVDWLDALNEFGPERVRRGLVGELDEQAEQALEGAGERALVREYGESEGRPVIPETSRDRARMYLFEKCRPPEARRWSLAHVQHDAAMGWHRWRGGEWRELPDLRLAAMVRGWLSRFWKRDRAGNLTAYDPRAADVKELIEALRTECWAELGDVPGWLADTFDGETPLWAGADRFDVPIDHDRRAERMLSFRNGVLDLDALLAGELELRPHEPGLFVSSVLPYDLPIGALRSIINGGADPLDVYRDVCPALTQLMQVASDGDDDWVACCQAMLGDAMTYDRTLEKIFMIQGRPRSGKGTLIEAILSIVGDRAAAFTSFGDLADKFELAPLVGRKVAIMADASVSDFADGSRAVERLKSISGNDGVRIRDLYVKANPYVRLTARFFLFLNVLPDLRDPSGALARRMVLLPMTGSALGNEDYSLKPRVALEGPGNAVFALMGYFNTWNAERPEISMPSRGRAMAEEFLRTSSPLAEFLDDRCELLDDARKTGNQGDVREWWTDASAVENAYRDWAQANGKSPRTRQSLGRDLPGLVPGWDTRRAREGNRRVGQWFGLRVVVPSASETSQASWGYQA